MRLEDVYFIRDELKCFFSSIRKIFEYNLNDRKHTTKKILVGGGYGYGNLGDEAQCDATLKLLNDRYSDYQIINLTPDILYSKKEHPDFMHDFASRTLFFNNKREVDGYNIDISIIKKAVFLLKSALIYFNAFLVRADLPTFMINARIAKFLYELKECSLFYFCGGGFLTGKTLSRLWDGILICRLAYVFRTPVVMSGQTIGIWENSFNEKFAKWGFEHVDVITVRDEEFSLKDLEKIGLKGENFFATHDDALYSEKSLERYIDNENYVTINFHYWGMKAKDKMIYLAKIHKIVEYILSQNKKLVFIPMQWADKLSYDEYIAKYPNNNFLSFEYNNDFRNVRRVIADSEICVTMKHHPIIFAMGENVPALSLAFSNYYVHKNVGALAQYGQEKFSVNLEEETCFEDFKNLFDAILLNKEHLKNEIFNRKILLNKRKENFLTKVDSILKYN